MKYIGLDLGSRTLGVAISDEMGILARAYDTLRFRDDDYEKAIEDYTKALEIDPNYVLAYHNRGYIKYHLNSYYELKQIF